VIYGEGFHPEEGDWRWTGLLSQLTIQNVAPGDKIYFDLACGKAEQYSQFPFNVFIYFGDSGAYSYTFEASDQVISVVLEADMAEVRIIIESSQAFVPALQGHSTDTRQLSLRFFNLHLDRDNKVETMSTAPTKAGRCGICQSPKIQFTGPATNSAYPQALETFASNPTVMIEVNSKCNFHCHYCRSVGSKRQKSFMDPKLYRHLLPQLKDITTHPIRLHIDGEPTLHPLFLDLSLETNLAGHRIALATNGSNMKKEFLQIDMDVIINISCSAEELSLRSAMNFTTYQNRLEQYLRDWKRSKSSQNIFMKIYSCQLELTNRIIMEHKKQFASNFLGRLGIDDYGKWSGNELIRRHEFTKPDGGIFVLSFQPITEGGLYPNISNLRQPGECLPSEQGFCDSPWKVLAVLSDGSVCFCCVDITGETSYTKPEEIWTKSLKEIWLADPRIHVYRQDFLSGNVRLPICKKCLDSIPQREQYLFQELFTFPIPAKPEMKKQTSDALAQNVTD
jgi:organic radical activating enzyme